MTEFLKGYAAGANDMEAGRLVTKDQAIEDAKLEGYQRGLERGRTARVAELEASALTAAEAEEMLNGSERQPTAASELLRQDARIKLSLIANGENDGS